MARCGCLTLINTFNIYLIFVNRVYKSSLYSLRIMYIIEHEINRCCYTILKNPVGHCYTHI